MPIGRYRLEVGGDAGTLIVSRTSDGDPAELAQALRAKPARRSAIEVTESAEELAARAAGGLELLTDVLKGAVLEPERVTQHADLLFELLQRLDDEGRLADALRVARAVNGALALAMRWAELVRSLRLALRAAGRLKDKPARAWAHHELGTLHLAAEDMAAAKRHLSEAARLRRDLGDADGLAATAQNLGFVCRRLRDLWREGGPRRWRTREALVLAVAIVLLLFVGAAAMAIVRPPHHDDPQLIAWVEGQGRVVSAPAGIDCKIGRCVASFDRGKPVRLTAKARPGSRFTGWSGDCKGRGACDVRLNGTRTVTAHFAAAPKTRTLRVHTDGDGHVDGSSGIDCGPLCTAHILPGTKVRLTAKATGDATFMGWKGPCTGAGACEFTMHDDVTVRAAFDDVPKTHEQRTLTVTRTGAGTVTSTPAGIDCGRRCVKGFPKDREVALAAAPDDGSRFVSWGGRCARAKTCTVTLHDDVTVSARFEKLAPTDPTLTVDRAGDGTGTVVSRQPGIACGDDCSNTYPAGTTVVLVASAGAGSTFAAWDGGGCSGRRLCRVTLNAPTTVTATFEPRPRPRLTTSSTGPGTVSPPCADGCAYAEGDTVTITATPDSNAYLASFSGCTRDASDPQTCTVTMSGDQTVSANFADNEP